MIRALIESEERYRRLVEASHEGVWSTDALGRTSYANARLGEMLGLSVAELHGRMIFDFMDEKSAFELRTLYSSRQRGRSEVHDLAFLRVNGQTLFARVSLSPLIERGEFTGMLAVIGDVSRERAAQAALRESEQRYRSLVDTLPDPILVQADGELLFVNHAAVRVLGAADVADLVGRPVLDILDVDSRPAWEQQVSPRDETTRPIAVVRLRTLQDTFIDAEVSASPVLFDGRPATQVVARDITERLRLEAQLRQAQKMEAVGQLAGGIAHDFNNLLTIIKGNAALVLDTLEQSHESRVDVEEIIRAATRAASLTRQLLAFSRKQVLRPLVLDPNAAIREAESMMRRLAGAEIRLMLALAEDPGQVLMDPVQLQQVLFNLVVNARDAMPSGGTITIRTSRHSESEPSPHPAMPRQRYVVMEVEDTGTGITPEVRARMFEPFFTTKEPGKGTGLGLSTVYGILKQSNGFIWCDSVPGRSTVFRIFLPTVAA